MNRKRYLSVTALAFALAGATIASAATQLGAVSVRIAQHPSVHGDVRVAFRPDAHLPRGGYYYAVVVLKGYQLHSEEAPPRCAISSDMERTAYGYPRRGHLLELALAPAKSADNEWCPGGTYIGAVYAVPHKPRCSASYPCRGKSTQNNACWEIGGRPVCGVVAIPLYSYPGGLPKPIDHSSRIVGRFQVRF